MQVQRQNAHKRGYTRRWEVAREMYLRENPLCLGCQAAGRSVPAVLVDHIVPHRGDQRLFWDRNNWQPSCRWHHDAVKLMLEREYLAQRLTSVELLLCSSSAVRLTHELHRPAVGADGFAISGS